MKLYLTSKQSEKFPQFESLLRKDLPQFVHQHPSVCKALIKWGMTFSIPPPYYDHPSTIPDTPQKRRAMLTKALTWGTSPQFMVMGHGMEVTGEGGDDWYGKYKHGNIAIYRPLVEQWELKPENKVLYRSLIGLVLHELVHFFVDEIFPGYHLYPNEDKQHLKAFKREALAPLGWERAHYELIPQVLEMNGVN